MHAATFDEVVRRTAAFAATSRDPWIIGDGWDQNLWPDKNFPAHDALSAAIPTVPSCCTASTGTRCSPTRKRWSSRASRAATQEPAGGRILRDAHGAPSGVFIDNARTLVTHAIPPATHDQLVRASEAALKECHRWGLTAIGDPGNGQNVIAAYEELARAGRYTLRNHVMLAGSDAALVDAYLARGPRTLDYGGRLSFRAIKLYVDGALGSRGAALLAPYSDDPGNTGLLRTAQADVQRLCERALKAGFQVCTHAIGDRGNRVVLDAYEAALRTATVRDHRFRIEHAQVLAPEDIPRFARLGVIPSMQSTHQISDMAWAQARLGPDRVRGAYAWRALLDTGVTIANGTDAPVEAVNSLRTFHAAITRENEANQPAGGWYPRQRMTRREALKSMTIWAARANFMEHAAGSITVGKYADFAVLDRDWMRCRAGSDHGDARARDVLRRQTGLRSADRREDDRATRARTAHRHLLRPAPGLTARASREAHVPVQRVRLHHRVAAGDFFGRHAREDAAHRNLHLLAGERVRDRVDADDLVGDVPRAAVGAQLRDDARAQRVVDGHARRGAYEQRHEELAAGQLQAHDEAVRHVVERFDGAIDLRRADAHAVAVERGVRAAVDVAPAARVELDEIAVPPHAGKVLEVRLAIARVARDRSRSAAASTAPGSSRRARPPRRSLLRRARSTRARPCRAAAPESRRHTPAAAACRRRAPRTARCRPTAT